MPRPKVSNKRLRGTQRTIHLLGGLMLGIYIYIPLMDGPVPQFAETLMQLAIFPAIAVTGMLMWQLPRLRRLLKRTRQGGTEIE